MKLRRALSPRHVELVVDRAHPVGATHAAGVCDIQLESALSTICDAEDSACTVDADDKLVVCAQRPEFRSRGALPGPRDRPGPPPRVKPEAEAAASLSPLAGTPTGSV